MPTGEDWYNIGVPVAEIMASDFVVSHLGEDEKWLRPRDQSNARLENLLRAIEVPLRTGGLDGQAINQAICDHFKRHPSALDTWYHLGKSVELVTILSGARELRGMPRKSCDAALVGTLKELAAVAVHIGESAASAVGGFLDSFKTARGYRQVSSASSALHDRLREIARRSSDDVDVGIITVKEEEMEAVLAFFPETTPVKKRRYYNTCSIDTTCRVGIVRCVEQGTGEAQAIARDFVDDMSPKWLLLVGIAGGAPRNEFSLGDVVVSTKALDLTVEARGEGGKSTFQVSGGWMPEAAAKLAANLPAMKKALGTWNDRSRVGDRPQLDLRPDRFYGDAAWQEKVRESLEYHHATVRPPKFTAGQIVSSDRLLKDPELLQFWLDFARDTYAIEMESAGVYRAVRDPRIPFLAIRGISDIVGFKRSREWTLYACATAASFTRALINTRSLL